MQVAFYDTKATTGVLLQGLNEDTNGVQNATGEKVAIAVLALPGSSPACWMRRTCSCWSALFFSVRSATVPQVGQFIHHMATFIGGIAIGMRVYERRMCRV